MKQPNIFIIFLVILLILSILISITLGRYNIPVDQLYNTLTDTLFDHNSVKNTVAYKIIFQVRLPRILLAALVGMSLSVSGAVLQGIFRNPLVGPGIIGVSSGAGFGAVTAILLSAGSVVVMLFSFIGGIIALVTTLSVAGRVGTKNVLSLILGGIVSGAFFSALISIVTFIADPRDTLPVIVYWLMGSFSDADVTKVWILGVISIICFIIIYRSRYVINLLALGDEEAYALGVKVSTLRMLFLGLTTLMTAAAVAVSGTISWVGLVVPHIARLIVGPDYRNLIITSALIGAIYLVITDTLIRVSPLGEIPIGILSALVGAPVLGYLLRTQNFSK